MLCHSGRKRNGSDVERQKETMGKLSDPLLQNLESGIRGGKIKGREASPKNTIQKKNAPLAPLFCSNERKRKWNCQMHLFAAREPDTGL